MWRKASLCIEVPGSSFGKESACNAGNLSLIPGSGRSLEKEMVTYSSMWAFMYILNEEGLADMKNFKR